MNKTTVLIEGYARVHADGSWNATSTMTLIESKGRKVIVDPGCNRQLLLKKLQEFSINLKDVNWVFLTHRHLDHSALSGIFPKAKVIDGQLFQDGHHGEMHQGIIPGTEVKIIKTAGHTPYHASLLAKTKEGTVAIAGDVFWWLEGEEQKFDIGKKDDFAEGSFTELKRSRRLLLKKADIIIPGHGKKMTVAKGTFIKARSLHKP